MPKKTVKIAKESHSQRRKYEGEIKNNALTVYMKIE